MCTFFFSFQHQYISDAHEKLNESKPAKKSKKSRKKAGSSSYTVAMDTDEESNMWLSRTIFICKDNIMTKW